MTPAIPGFSGEIDPDTRLDDAFRAVAAEIPDHVALTTGPERYTYDDLDRWSDAIAAAIIASDAPLDRPVAIVTSDNVALVPCILGVAKAGHYFIMIDASDPEERIALLLEESTTALCLVDAHAPAPAAIGELPRVAIPALPKEPVVPTPQRDPNDLVFVIFTSGTTGKPKGIATRRRNYVEHLLGNAMRFGSRLGTRRFYSALPGYVRAANTTLPTLLTGGTLCAFDARKGSLAALAQFIARARPELVNMTPSLFRRLVAANPPGLDFSSVRSLRLGADRVTLEDIEAFKRLCPRGATLGLGFASTETGPVFRYSIDHDTVVPGPVPPMGTPTAGVEVRLVDDDGNDVAVGETGEIVVRSPHVVDGYWNNPELTAEKFTTDPDDPGVRTFRTGDLARRDENGLYYFVGRKDARLKIHGRRIDPSEVESALVATELVRDAVIVGKPDARGDHELVAYVVMREGVPFAPRHIRVRLRGKVPVWMIPSRIHAIDAIPLTAATKIDRQAPVDRGDPVVEEDDGATDSLERQLVEIWTRVIGRPVHVDDDFFDDLGGESLMAAHIAADVERLTGKSITPSSLVALNTVATMAEYLRGADAAAEHVIELQKGTTLPPLFCVAGGGGAVLKFRPLAAALGPDQPFYGVQLHALNVEDLPKTFAGIAAAYAEAIRGIQPEGPYHIAGYSAGGKLAYEIACQMLRAGEHVAFLGMIDTGAVHTRAPVWERIRNRLEILWNNPERAAAFAREAARRPARWMTNRIVQKLLGRGIAVPSKIIESSLKLQEVRKQHVLGPYDGKLTLFCARHGLRRVRADDDLGWGSLGVKAIDIIDVDGDHETMLDAAHVNSLATAVREALANASEATG